MQKLAHHRSELIPATRLDGGVRIDLLLQSVRGLLRCRVIGGKLGPARDFHVAFGHIDVAGRVLRRFLSLGYKSIKELASFAADFRDQLLVTLDHELNEIVCRAIKAHEPTVLRSTYHQLMLNLYAVKPSGGTLKPVLSNVHKR